MYYSDAFGSFVIDMFEYILSFKGITGWKLNIYGQVVFLVVFSESEDFSAIQYYFWNPKIIREIYKKKKKNCYLIKIIENEN